MEFLPEEIDLTVQTCICALMLAFPGVVRTTRNAWLLDGKRSAYRRTFVSTIHESIEYIVENGVIPRTDIDPKLAIEWAYSQGGVFNGRSNNPAARAFNYFTRLFVEEFRNDELGDLVWALAGMEALLVEGGRSSAGQIREKLDTIYGTDSNRAWLIEMTQKMYRYRSGMVHGDRQIKSTFRHHEGDTDARFYEEYDSARFAIGLLVMLLQHVMICNATHLQFKTTLVP